MKKMKCLSAVLCMAIALVCVHGSAFGQSGEEKNKLAAIAANGASVRWDVAVPYAALTMSVSAPNGQIYRKEFQAGEAPSFALFDRVGHRLPDGQYNYELVFSPVLAPGVKGTLAASREKGNDVAVAHNLRQRGLLPAQPLIQSGTFSVQKGRVFVGAASEGAEQRVSPGKLTGAQKPTGITPYDNVINDDLIVTGSTCIGFDCVDGEAFAFDTLRLKENNLRIHFEDTSVGSFPANDWRLVANDSASGGASRFSIEDATASRIPFTIRSGAPDNSIFVSSTGRVGLRTSTPALDIHAITGDTPAIRLEQNGSGGFTPQTWDIGGNEANFFIRDLTGGSRLSFRIRPGAPTSSIDIKADGNVGIGSATADRKLHVDGTSWAVRIGKTAALYLDMSPNQVAAFNNGAASPLHLNTSNAGNVFIANGGGSVGVGTSAPDQKLSVNGDASKAGGGSWQTFSDLRLKTVKGQFKSGLKALMQLQPLRYEYKQNNAMDITSVGEHVGFAAQAVQKIIPEAVTRNDKGYLLVNNDPILWTMLNAIKEQQREIEQLKAEVRQLRSTSRRRR